MKYAALLILVLGFFGTINSSHAESCAEFEQKIRVATTKANHCKQVQDCISPTGFGCALGCHLLINRAEESALRELNDIYMKECAPGLICDCIAFDGKGNSIDQMKIACKQGKCVR
jgi:hypothetical protein